MVPETVQTDFTTIEIPQIRRGPWGFVKIIAAVVAIAGLVWAWQAGYRPPMLLAGTKFFGNGHPMSGLDPARLGAKTPWRSSVRRNQVRRRSDPVSGSTASRNPGGS